MDTKYVSEVDDFQYRPPEVVPYVGSLGRRTPRVGLSAVVSRELRELPVATRAMSTQRSDTTSSTEVASTNRTAGAPELYSGLVSVYVYRVFDVAVIVIRVVHVDGGVRTWTLMFSSWRYPLTFSAYEIQLGRALFW